MAAKGRLYKLWFRRDYTDFDDYAFGFPEAFISQDFDIRSTVFNLHPLYFGLAINLYKGSGTQRIWTSEPSGGPGISVRMQVEFTDIPADVQTNFTFRLLVNDIFRIFEASWPNRLGPNRYNSAIGSPFAGHTTIQDTRLTVNPLSGVQFRAARYDEYNP